MTNAQRIAAAAAIALATFGIVIGTLVTAPTPNPTFGCPSTSGVTFASPGSWTPLDPAVTTAYSTPAVPIESLVGGGVFNGNGGCFVLGNGNGTKNTAGVLLQGGIAIAHNNVKIENATFYQPGTPTCHSTWDNAPWPIISVVNLSGGSGNSAYAATNTTLLNLNLIGTNSAGAEINVCEHALNILGAANTHVTNVSTYRSWGDGLNAFSAFSQEGGFYYPNLVGKVGVGNPTTALNVNGFTTVGAGRDGLTTSYVSGGTFNNVSVAQAGPVAWSFESDLNNVGASNLNITNCNLSGNDNNGGNVKGLQTAINITGQLGTNEGLQGPVTFDHCIVKGYITMYPSLPSALLTVSNTAFYGQRICPGTPVANIWLQQSNAYFLNDSFQSVSGSGNVTCPLWGSTAGSNLTFQNPTGLTTTGPVGSSGGTSTVSILP